MKKGFTLIELLAVIVILAIIALITIPAVLKMTDNAKISSYRRSIDLYGRAINSAIAAYKSDMIEKKQPYTIGFPNVENYIDYEGYDIDCKTSKIYSDDTILLTECTVEKDKVYAEKGKGYGKENYYYYTNSKKRIRTLDYIDQVNIALKKRQNIGNTCQVQENGNLICNGQQVEVTVNIGKPKTGTLTIQNNTVTSYTNLQFEEEKAETQQEVPTIVDEGEINTGDNQNNNGNNNGNNNNNTNNSQNNNNTTQTIISTAKDYRGYYADVDGDGTADGVIYADLAFSKEETTWGRGKADIAKYSKEEDLKEYTISENKYTGERAKFGKKEIITAKSNSSGKSRFYVMALNDFTTGSMTGYYAGMYYWYKNAKGRMSDPVKDTKEDFGEGYKNTGTMIRIWNNNGLETGWTEGATQNNKDIWKHIQGEYAKGWYIPSLGEWVVFADYLANREENPLTSDKIINYTYDGSGNYDDIYGLYRLYSSSSQNTKYAVEGVSFENGTIVGIEMGGYDKFRLGITF